MSSRIERARESALKDLGARMRRCIEILEHLVEIPTVAAWGGEAMGRGAGAVASLLRERGFRAWVASGGGHPVVMAELGSGERSLLIYNHYDVQPPDPLELWESDPFKLARRGELLIGRGVADNKGNIAARLCALEALAPYIDDLGLRIKVLVEGEEEIGSPTLEGVVRDNLGWLRSSGGIWETAYVKRDGRLGVSLGFKGMLYLEIVLRGASRDVHSGYAPLVPNPVWRMARLLTLLKDEEGRILVPGFRDGVDPEFLGHGEDLISRLGPEELESLKEELGIRSFVRGLGGAEALRELYLSPSLNVAGLYSGYTGKGSKTIVPSLAGAKIDIRPLPGQDPQAILERLRSYLAERGFGDAEIHVHSSYRAGYTKHSEEIVRASVRAAVQAYGLEPSLTPISGGSGPIYYFTHLAGTPMTGAGVGYYGSRAHAPNENIRVGDFEKGARHVLLTIIEFSKPGGPGRPA